MQATCALPSRQLGVRRAGSSAKTPAAGCWTSRSISPPDSAGRRRAAAGIARSLEGSTPLPEQRSATQPGDFSPLQRASLQLAGALAAAALVVLPAGDASAAAEYSLQGKVLFSPMAYSGRWYEVASLKKGFAGEGQQDCHCTQVRAWAARARRRGGWSAAAGADTTAGICRWVTEWYCMLPHP